METKESKQIAPEEMLVGICKNNLKKAEKLQWALNRSEAMSLVHDAKLIDDALSLGLLLDNCLKHTLTEEEWLDFATNELTH